MKGFCRGLEKFPSVFQIGPDGPTVLPFAHDSVVCFSAAALMGIGPRTIVPAGVALTWVRFYCLEWLDVGLLHPACVIRFVAVHRRAAWLAHLVARAWSL